MIDFGTHNHTVQHGVLNTSLVFTDCSEVFGIDVMEKAADQGALGGLTPAYHFKATYYGQFNTYIIDCIHSGLGFVCVECDGFPHDCFYWSPYKNNQSSPVGVSLMNLADGDVLKWVYTEFIPNVP